MKHLKKFNESHLISIGDQPNDWSQEEFDEIEEMFLNVEDDCHLNKTELIRDIKDYNICVESEDKIVIIIKTSKAIPSDYYSYILSGNMSTDKQVHSDIKSSVEGFIKQLESFGYIVKYKELTKELSLERVNLGKRQRILSRYKLHSNANISREGDTILKCGIRIEISK